MNIEQIKETLLSHYDCVTKIDAIRFVKRINTMIKVSDIVKAYNLAYD